MENHPDIPRGSCPRALGDSFSGPMRRCPLDSGQVPGRTSDLFDATVERKVLVLLCAQTLKDEVRSVVRQQSRTVRP